MEGDIERGREGSWVDDRDLRSVLHRFEVGMDTDSVAGIGGRGI
jgi:hypothetical protein